MIKNKEFAYQAGWLSLGERKWNSRSAGSSLTSVLFFSPSSSSYTSFLQKPLCTHPNFQSPTFDPGASLARALRTSDALFISPKPQADESASSQKWQLLIGQRAHVEAWHVWTWNKDGDGGRRGSGKGGFLSHTQKKTHKYHVWSSFFHGTQFWIAQPGVVCKLWWDLHVATDAEMRDAAWKCHVPPLLIYTREATTSTFDARRDGIWHPHLQRRWNLFWITLWEEKKAAVWPDWFCLLRSLLPVC